ncbi:MAG: pyridoxamine 5'-phosphate oxidase family protein [Proteobacteria bacterium]|nr:pyridoxamine 5'-phosphate oxidase family protein [Pseudomonadota bacterium]
MGVIGSIEDLEALYGAPQETSTAKEQPHLTDGYRALIEASPFYALATAGPEGLDCSPRGDLQDGIRIVDRRTLHLPDRRGNNRIDSLRNIVRDPRVALLFLIPGSGTTLRVNGRAEISADSDLLASFAVEGKPPRSVIIVHIETVYFQCARAIIRSDLWNPARHADLARLPTPGRILAEITDARVGGETYDREWPERAKKSMW